MKYFTLEELTYSETAARLRIDNTPNKYARQNLVILIEKCLDNIREKWGKPLGVTSGYRCEKLNDVVKGSKTSSHLKGQAADIYPLPNTKENRKILFSFIKNGGFEFDQLIWESGCVHIGYRVGNNRKQVLDLSYKY